VDEEMMNEIVRWLEMDESNKMEREIPDHQLQNKLE